LHAPTLAADAEGVPGVNALLDRIEKAHTSRDAKLLLDECTDDGLVAIVYGGQSDKRVARVMTKKQMTAELFNRMWTMRQLKSRRKTDRDILLAHPDIALLTATTVNTVADGGTTSHSEFYVARRSGGTWRICFAMPLLFRSTFVTAYVLPGSLAERTGLKVGDEVTSCAGMKTDRVASVQKIDALLRAEPKEVPLVVKRGAEELRITLPGARGLGGAGFERVIFPLAPAVVSGSDEPHPAKEHLKRSVESVRTGNFDGFEASFHPDGFFAYLPQRGKPARLIGSDEFGRLLRQASEKHRKMMDTSKTRVDNIRVISDGNVAIVAGDWTYKVKGKDERTVPTQAEIYVRRGDQWLKVAKLAQRARIGSP